MPEQDNYDDELVSANPNQRNWRGILIALLVIIIVLALIVTSVVLLTPPDEGPRVKGHRLKLQDIIDGEYVPIHVNGSWISATEFIHKNQWGGISLLNTVNLSERVLMSNITFKTLGIAKFTISADRKYLLLAQNIQKLFRHSYLAQYTVYDIQTSETFPLSPKPDDDEWPFLLHAQFTPRAHALVMIYNYDIFYRPGVRPTQTYRITDDGVPGIIYNGIPDWLYEEEILSTNTALWMSSDGHLMLHGSFNDSNVAEQRFAWFGTTTQTAAMPSTGTASGMGTGTGGIPSNLYPEIRSLRYPKPGTSNPLVTLTISDLADPKNIRVRRLRAPAVIANEDHYFTSANWVSQTEVSVVWMNRPQNLSVVTVCKSPMWICQETHRISGDNRGWVDECAVPYFAANGHFKHLVHVFIAKKRIIPLTHGKFEVNRIVHWDQVNNLVYFLAVPERRPSQQHLYRVHSLPPKLGASLRPPRCLTCTPDDGGAQSSSATLHPPPPPPPPPRLATVWDDDWEEQPTTREPQPVTPPQKRKTKKDTTPKGPPPCEYFTATFAPGDGDLVLVECLGPGVPTSAIYRVCVDIAQPPLKLVTLLQNNTALKEKLEKIALPQVRSFPVMISGGYHAQVRLLLPPGLREEEITRYPMILHVYSGPGTQLVTDKWRIDWNTYLAGTKDYIVTQIDGRGSSGQGYQLLHEVYRRLGSVEVSDQLEVTEYLRDTLHFVDKRRVGVWGWSYGGYTAAFALASPQALFQCGISVSPVTSWKLYDSTYTERFMGQPNVTDNYQGYEEAELAKQADHLRDKQFLLVHGTADDNVHYQQSMVLSRALTARGALFKQLIYPDEGHNLSGVKRHLYRSMTQFFEDCFRKQVPPEMKAGLGNGGATAND